MKKLAILLLLITYYLLPATAKSFRIAGHAEGAANDTMFIYIGRSADTLRLDAKGNFDYTKDVQQPSVAYLTLINTKSTLKIFAENDVYEKVEVRFEPAVMFDQKYNKPIIEFKGDNKDCNQILLDLEEWNNQMYTRTDLPNISFKDYRSECDIKYKDLRERMDKVKSEAFKKSVIMGKEDAFLIRYAWMHKDYDADFAQWMDSFDRNNMKSLDFANTYYRWYCSLHRPAEGEKSYDCYFKSLKTVFSNQDVINAIAQTYMAGQIQNATRDLPAIWEGYKNTSTDTVAIAKLTPKYEAALKTMPGLPCEDFTMQDADGHDIAISSLRGKAVYIDCWATWCGPCCREIPYLEKVVEHFKGDNRIEFISISFDSNKDAWLKKLAKDNPAWKQFICSSEQHRNISRIFDITGIPRFMLLDKDGQIVTANAPRPSDEKIIEFINKNLK